jgi:hypothetical protein
VSAVEEQAQYGYRLPELITSLRAMTLRLDAQGRAKLSVLRTCVTKRAKDMRYKGRGTSMVSSFGLMHDDAVCPGKRVVSWINVCNFYRPTKRKRCLFQSSAASSECHGPPDIDGSIATKRVGPKGWLISAVGLTVVRTRLQRRSRMQSWHCAASILPGSKEA